MFAGHEPEPGHELVRVREAADVTDFGDQRGCYRRIYNPQRTQCINDRPKSLCCYGVCYGLIQSRYTFVDLPEGALHFFEGKLLVRISELAQFVDPAPVDLCPSGRSVKAQTTFSDSTFPKALVYPDLAKPNSAPSHAN
jgi:hypothetical protein